MSDLTTPMRLNRILFGGDYNPEPAGRNPPTMRLMRRARVNVATLPVFGWSAIQPAEDTFTFGWLDRVIDKLHAGGVGACAWRRRRRRCPRGCRRSIRTRCAPSRPAGAASTAEGTNRSRVFKECQTLGRELEALGDRMLAED